MELIDTVKYKEPSSLGIALTLVRGPGRLSAIAPRLAPLLLFFRTAKYMVKRRKLEKLDGAGCDDTVSAIAGGMVVVVLMVVVLIIKGVGAVVGVVVVESLWLLVLMLVSMASLLFMLVLLLILGLLVCFLLDLTLCHPFVRRQPEKRARSGQGFS